MHNDEQYFMQPGKYNAARPEPLLIKKLGVMIITKSQIEFRIAGKSLTELQMLIVIMSAQLAQNPILVAGFLVVILSF